MEKKVIWTFLKIGFSLSLLTYIIWLVDFKEVLRILKSADIAAFGMIFILFLFDQWLCAYGWHILLKNKGVSISLKNLGIIVLESTFFGFLLPSSIGPDIIRAYTLSKKTSNLTEAISSLLVLRAVTLLSLYTLAVFSLTLYYDKIADKRFIYTIGGSLLILGIAGFGIFLRPFRNMVSKFFMYLNAERVRDKVERLYSSLLDYSKGKKALILSFSIMLLSQILRAILAFFLGKSLDIDVPIISYLLYLPLVSIIIKIPISIGGLGLGEGSLIYFFIKAGMSYNEAFTITIMLTFVNIGIALVGGILYGIRNTFILPRLREL